MSRLIAFFHKDILFSISFVSAILSISIGRFQASDIDFSVIASLFGLMLVINGLEDCGILGFLGEKLVQKSKSQRQLIRAMVFLSFSCSMILTNDVAILTLLPIYLKISKVLKNHKTVLLGAVYLIVAANLGSSFFPFGNPQNLFLYHFYTIPVSRFFLSTGSLMLVSFFLLVIATHFISAEPLQITLKIRSIDRKKGSFLTFFLLVMVAGIFDVFPYQIALLITALGVFLIQKDLFRKVDYRLLATFICFFIIVGNLQQSQLLLEFLRPFFEKARPTFFTSLFLSQVISNVPAAILAGPFTKHWQAVLLGVDIGGLGTLIASLANLIGFRLVKLYLPDKQKLFLKTFTKINLIFLAILVTLFMWLV